jgi:hypothetical protein
MGLMLAPPIRFFMSRTDGQAIGYRNRFRVLITWLNLWTPGGT